MTLWARPPPWDERALPRSRAGHGTGTAAVELTVIGSGTAVPEAQRVSAAFWVAASGTRVLLDCGPGAVHHLARFGLPWPDLDHLVISHFHNDHIGDIPALMFALKWGVAQRRTAPLEIWGPSGLGSRLASMAEAFGDHVIDPGFPVHVREVSPGGHANLADRLGLECAETPHTDHSLAYRLAGNGATLGYTGDTGPSTEVGEFLRGVDLMVAECALPDEEAMETHLTPSSLADMARIADPRRLLVTHVYPQLARQDVAGLLRAAGWTGQTLRAEDGLRVRL
jgi:ribonuclease BN (tRNA processing enzyme)